VWDESFAAMNTYEMMADHDYIVTHSWGHPDMYITKPPLLIWCMVLSSKVLGFSELSIRLPNAIAGCIVCLLLFFFCASTMDSPLVGFLAVLTLISSSGFITLHVIRSGEYDAFLTLFVFIYCLSFFMILENKSSDRKVWHWLFFTIAVICAILTKGVAGIVAIPGLIIYVVSQHKLFDLLRSKEIYLSMFFIVLFGLGYYFLREHLNPGYLNAVNNNELGGRYINTNEGHAENFLYYWKLIACNQLIFIMPFIFVGIIKAFINDQPNRIYAAVRFCTYVSAIFILVISISSTKLSWYDAPVIPMITLVAGFGFSIVLSFLFGENISTWSIRNKIITTVFVLALVGPAYGDIISNNLDMTDFEWNRKAYTVTYYIKRKQQQNDDYNSYKVINDTYLARPEMCQIKALEHKGKKLEMTEIGGLKAGDRVITDKENVRMMISNRFNYLELDSLANVKVWQLLDERGKPGSF
jgi:4-amino-4-deoxy-L-arabinose transferase-like glycosyltransferase